MFGFGNKNSIGYETPLYIFIMDHRTSFLEKTLEIAKETNDPSVWEEVSNLKKIIYQGYLQALSSGVPPVNSTFFIDEQTGMRIIEDAQNQGIEICLALEKSGNAILEFENDSDYVSHVERIKPKFVKVLVRYNPGDPDDQKILQQQKLSEISKFAQTNKVKLIIEVRVPALPAQLEEVGNNIVEYDLKFRPNLALNTLVELKSAGADPDIWHFEGFDQRHHYIQLIDAIRSNGRDKVGMVIMSRGAPFPQVENWLKVGASVPGVMGFSVGRTAFHTPIKQFRSGDKSSEDAISQIAQNFLHFYQIFLNAQKG